MKKIIFILIAAIGLTISSCKKLEDYNKDTKSATAVSSSSLFANGLRNLVDQETITSVNFNIFRAVAQYWTETTYPDESNYDITTRQIPDREFLTIYRDVLANLKEAKRVIATETSLESSVAEKGNKTAVTEILSVFAFQREVDIFGNIPYFQALDISILDPEYDDAHAIYEDLFKRLDAAIAMIDVSAAGFEEGDLVYGGDMSMWKLFANSLKLKMAITVADVADLDPHGKATSAVTGGVFSSSSDNAFFSYLGASPNTNPIWVDLVASGRYDWVAANTIVDIMNGLADPRRPLYFDENLGAGTFDGGIYGANNTYDNFTHITPTIQEPDYRGLLMSYSEVVFYLAEAAARGWAVGSTPQILYSEGIRASIMDDWGGSFADVGAYLLNPDVDFTTAPGTDLEKIALQSWLSSYNRGLIGWTTKRRLDFPPFNLPAITGNALPLRYTYPSTEQTLNGTNYTNAAIAMDGDLQSSNIFWDIH